MRSIPQPGPAAAERIQCVASAGRRFTAVLPAGQKLLDSVAQVFAEHGFSSGALRLDGGGWGPFAYVIPALSETPDHAAFYSATLRPEGVSRLVTGAMTLGRRDDRPFFHCHALWSEADGTRRCGHVLPEETVIAEPIAINAIGLAGAAFVAETDPETNFRLFGPVAASAATDAYANFFALRLRPNQDITGSLENFCRERKISAARLHGGVGSIIGAHYDDDRIIKPFATEMALRSGHIAPAADGEPRAMLDIVLIDHTGSVSEGRMLRGDNPVFITFEVVLEATARPGEN